MSDNTSPKRLKNLADFASKTNISTESLKQILEKLNQAGITIKSAEEELSDQQKAQVLAFFKKKLPSNIRQTRVSNLSSGSTKKNVKITTFSRKPIPESITTVENKVEQEPISIEKTSTKTLPSKNNEVVVDSATTKSEFAWDNPDSFEKKQKTSPTKKKKKVDSFKSTKRYQHLSSHDILEAHLDEDPEKSLSETPYIQQSTAHHNRQLQQSFKRPIKSIIKDVDIYDQITVSELAKKMSIKEVDMRSHLEKMGMSPENDDTSLDQETAALIVEEMGHHPQLVLHNEEERNLKKALDQQLSEPKERPPIITIMGHVDHGKTSLLDTIRRTQIAAKEAGSITQHIGAYHIKTLAGATLKKGITFLDTPGHAAFTAMRARGTQITDIVALVVAADDGVMPQTIEAIEHAQAAGAPIVVVINKIDKLGNNLYKLQQSLARYNLIAEEVQGDTLFVSVSAKTGKGIDQLIQALLKQSEKCRLIAPFQGPAQGTIIEARVDKYRGPVVTMILQKGMLKKGDILLVGTTFGRIKALHNEYGKPMQTATPSIPIEILGLSAAPAPGEEAWVVPSERKAREIAQARATVARQHEIQAQTNRSLAILMDPFNSQLQKSIHVILKADVQGSAEALKTSILKLSTENIVIKAILTGVGAITESDINLAIASKAIIFGFNVKTDNTIKRLIQRENVRIYYHSVIYELLDEAKKIVDGLEEPKIQETTLGKATVKEIFRSAKNTITVGCIVTEGTLRRHQNIRILRKQATVYQGKLQSLRRFKDDVKEVHHGNECGISIKNHTDLAIGDMIESYESSPMTNQS